MMHVTRPSRSSMRWYQSLHVVSGANPDTLRSHLFDFLSLLSFQDPVDGFVQNRAVPVYVPAFGIRPAPYQIKPARAIGVLVDEGDFLLQGRVAADELPFRDAKQVGNGFEPFDPAEDLARLHRRVRLDLKAVVHHVAQHAHCEFGETDAPQTALVSRDPAVRRAEKIIHRQLGREVRTLVVERLWSLDGHAVLDSYNSSRQPNK